MKFQTNSPEKSNVNTVVLYLFEDEEALSDTFKYFDNLSDDKLSEQIFNFKAFEPKFNTNYKLAVNGDLKLIVAGLGKRNQLTRQKFSQVVSSCARLAKTLPNTVSLGFELIEFPDFTKEDCAKMTLSSARIGLYEFNKYIKDRDVKIDTIELIDKSINSDIEKAAQVGAYTSFAMKFTKDLVNEPAQVATPNYIANLAKDIAKEHNFDFKILSVPEIKKLGMNAFLAVGQGSINEPKFIHLTYKPSCVPRKKIALVGKGITFDAGGMNIKPATSMLNMKDDMTGAASVLGIIQAVSMLKADVELHVVSALCENMTSGKAYKQGDVLTAMNGKTIEVDNTDAEGRITLADALCYCDSLNVDEVIDIATLTGAVIVSLGTNITGVMGNNQSQIDKFIKSASKSGENVWQMPILDELKDNLKSEIADFKNTGGRNAGTSTAAWFLSNFTKSKRWLHLDIAGTAYLEKSNKETLFGPTGVMIRSLIDYILS